MKKQKTTIIKPKKVKEKDQNNYKLIFSIIMLVIGIILFTNSNKAVIIICYTIGTIITLIGAYNLFNYYRLKKELNIDNPSNLVIGVTTLFIGLITIILASAIETFLRFIIGIILIFSGIRKIKNALDFNNYFALTIGIIFVAIGLYTILAENIIFMIVGILLIISSILDIIEYFREKK